MPIMWQRVTEHPYLLDHWRFTFHYFSKIETKTGQNMKTGRNGIQFYMKDFLGQTMQNGAVPEKNSLTDPYPLSVFSCVTLKCPPSANDLQRKPTTHTPTQRNDGNSKTTGNNTPAEGS